MKTSAASMAKADGSAARFNIDTLRELSGEKAFARGVAYHKDKRVDLVSIDRSRVVAKVTGTEVYDCKLMGAGADFSSECTCPAFSDWGFCKHLVATALHVNELGPQAVQEAAGRLAGIRKHLRAKGVEPLVEMIVELAERDASVLKELELAAAIESSDDETLFAQFKKAITEATRTRGFVEYREARQWTKKIETVLDRIESLIESGRAPLVLRLLGYFFKRMDDALNSMDDSDGDGGAVYAKAGEIHLVACRVAEPEPIALARELFAREVDSGNDFFHLASEAYADVLGDAGLAEYRRLANEAWQKIKPRRAAGRPAVDDQYGARYALAAILQSFAEHDGDVEASIAVRAKDLSTAHAYLEIAQFCLGHGREADALKWAEDGLWQFEDQPDERLVFFAADLYARQGRKQDADRLLWQTFERLPSIGLYRRIKAAAGSDAAASTEARDRAITLLRLKFDAPGATARWSSPRELLLDILVLEKLFQQAWDVVRTHGCSDARLGVLAKASEQSFPAEALAAYARAVEGLVRLGGQTNYAEAGKIIARMQAVRHRIGADAEHAAYVAEFMHRHKAKRNFMKILA